MGIAGRIVAIAGASGALGRQAAHAFAGAGATLAVAGRRLGDLERLLDAISLPAGRRLSTAVDLTDEAAAKNWAARILDAFGRIDIVLHQVGGFRETASIGEILASDWELIHNALVITTLNVARAFAPCLKSSGWGRFIAVTSPRAQVPSSKTAVYAMGKAAADALVLALADELAGTGATANMISVASITDPDRQTGAKGNLGGSATVEEIAAAMLYLCSDEAGAINGARLPLLGRA